MRTNLAYVKSKDPALHVSDIEPLEFVYEDHTLEDEIVQTWDITVTFEQKATIYGHMVANRIRSCRAVDEIGSSDFYECNKFYISDQDDPTMRVSGDDIVISVGRYTMMEIQKQYKTGLKIENIKDYRAVTPEKGGVYYDSDRHVRDDIYNLVIAMDPYGSLQACKLRANRRNAADKDFVIDKNTYEVYYN